MKKVKHNMAAVVVYKIANSKPLMLTVIITSTTNYKSIQGFKVHFFPALVECYHMIQKTSNVSSERTRVLLSPSK